MQWDKPRRSTDRRPARAAERSRRGCRRIRRRRCSRRSRRWRPGYRSRCSSTRCRRRSGRSQGRLVSVPERLPPEQCEGREEDGRRRGSAGGGETARRNENGGIREPPGRAFTRMLAIAGPEGTAADTGPADVLPPIGPRIKAQCPKPTPPPRRSPPCCAPSRAATRSPSARSSNASTASSGRSPGGSCALRRLCRRCTPPSSCTRPMYACGGFALVDA